MDDQTKAKGLMAAGLFTLAAIGLVVVLVVLPAIHTGSGTPTAVAQPGPPSGGPGPPDGSGPAGPPGGGGGMPGAPSGMPGAPGGMPGAPGGMPGAPGGAGGAGGAAAAAPARLVDPLEESRENPFAPFGSLGLVSEDIPAGLAFTPGPRTMPVGLFEQRTFPAVGPNGQTIQVPSGAPSRPRATGPKAPPKEEWMRVAAIMQDAQGRAMVVLQAGQGEKGAVLQVGDRYRGWRVEEITKTKMVLARQEDGEVRKRTVHLRVGGARRGGRRGGGARPGVAVPGGGGAGGQPGVRRPGGARPGAFPGVGEGGDLRRTRPRPQ